MCKQKTDSRVFLEEYLALYFPNRSYNIVPYHFYKKGSSLTIEHDNRTIYFGTFSVGDASGNDLLYFDTAIPFFGGVEQPNLLFTSFTDFIDVVFMGYMVTFEVSLHGGTIK